MSDRLLIRGHAPTVPGAVDLAQAVHDGTAVGVRVMPTVWRDHPGLASVTLAIDAVDTPLPSADLPCLQLALPDSVVASVPARRRTFLAGRAAAALGLRQLGADATSPIGIAPHRGPAWPVGILGSISHTSEIATAVVARDRRYRGVGTDVQPLLAREVAGEIAPMVAPEWPTAWDDSGGPLSCARAITTIFSAKESLYKCLRPHVSDFFDFTEARLVFWEPAVPRCRLQLLRTLSDEVCEGALFDVTLRWHEDVLHSLVLWSA